MSGAPDGPCSPTMSSSIALAEALITQMTQHALLAYPEECCGFLVGTIGSPKMIERIVPTANAVRTQRAARFEIDPLAWLAVDQAAADEGMEVVGFYHSHPDCAARPSRIDVERAWPVYSYAIVDVRRHRTRGVRSWVLDANAERFIEEPIQVRRERQ
jgi:proteasome lid subunit RPN8/RPN11